MPRRIIGFLSDFGTRDYYVAAVKAVIYGMCPDAEVVDISHEVTPWSIQEACYVLSCCYEDFPPGTVFLAVVDPGVGTSRKPIIVQTEKFLFVGPDNGLLTCVAPKPYRAWEITRVPGERKKFSYTFHGRDVFAPVAAFLACGGRVEEVAREYGSPVDKGFLEPRIEDGMIHAEVLHVDRFGNVALNISEKHLEELGRPGGLVLKIGGVELAMPFGKTFGDVQPGELVAYIDSCGYLEIAVNQGDASRRLGVKPGSRLEIVFK
jgi:S-adenosylmethionine hydrolase